MGKRGNMIILPPQQIIQSNGVPDSLRMSPNSSVLIADSINPIVYRCVSDGIGNVSTEAYDISPHKSEEQIEKENILDTLRQINDRLEKLENESTFTRNEYPDKTIHANYSNGKKPSNGFAADSTK